MRPSLLVLSFLSATLFSAWLITQPQNPNAVSASIVASAFSSNIPIEDGSNYFAQYDSIALECTYPFSESGGESDEEELEEDVLSSEQASVDEQSIEIQIGENKNKSEQEQETPDFDANPELYDHSPIPYDLFALEYGIHPNNYTIHQGFIKKNECFGDLLSACNIPRKLINEIDQSLKKGDKSFDLRSIAAGKPYTALCDTLSQRAQYFIYEENLLDFVLFDLRQPNNIQIYKRKKNTQTRIVTAAGEIQGSLYETLENNHIDPQLAQELSKVFAWSIDFFHLRAGDRFKAVYEQRVINGQAVSIGNIQSAYFLHNEKEYYAFSFEQNGALSYFDQEGKSNRKAFLKAPLKFSRISSPYTHKRLHPVSGRTKPHLGTDYAAPTGTPVVSVGDGVVEKVARSRGNGNFVKIRHNHAYATQYLHLSRFGKGIKTGTNVRQGQIIGYVGSTGMATGPHLCFRFWKNGVQVDPYKERIPNDRPIPQDQWKNFELRRDSLLQTLNTIQYSAPPKTPDSDLIASAEKIPIIKKWSPSKNNKWRPKAQSSKWKPKPQKSKWKPKKKK